MKDLEKIEGTCEICGKPMVVRQGKFGPFLACTGYPACTNTRPIEKGSGPKVTEVPCPNEGCAGEIMEKTSRKGRKFYACNQYPQCRFAMWDEPYADSCPECGTRVLGIKRRKVAEPVLACRNKGCKFTRPLSPV